MQAVLSVLPLATLLAGPFGPNITGVATFGDSYTATSPSTATGGTAWPTYLADYANITLYSFAVSGAACDDNLTPRTLPDVTHDELGAYFNLTANTSSPLDPSSTLYTLWIGTNDVGQGELISGQGASGVTVVNTTECAVQWIKTLYDGGARNFLFQNMLPLDLLPEYQADSYPNHYWSAQRNTTEWNVFMKELVASGNTLSKLMIQIMAPSLPGATIGYFDSHALFTDMHDNPSLYLNGTAPLNVTGSIVSCILQVNESTSDPGDCTIAQGTDRDSFLFFDEIHPSEQADRVVAREIAKVLNGTSERWVTVFKG
ncbi:carbohydrate esterase family 16 protein [Punctularia strigosozonata HHB-11173 SS5]|uniref:carbohydrate esterase family 16 protein n=1 Tax=Punctularia strigosozonata (strain HHB-11173) TaxID=741275 RepID=UPI000441738B|nr:carbohydrate esterase family 16 protein [Punctularia strigosozonata HHB-11173 SS5]EIN06960.1 carbohydrate esterase family 16 protein [Punctularia strigosozonata HHB-11173 SS5]